MAETRTKVFLSGTRGDLRAYWDVAPEAVSGVPGFDPIAMEDGTAEPIPPDYWSRREASTHDLVLFLLGRCYGRVPSGQTLSLTEQEYEAAGAAGLDRLVFLTLGSAEGVVAQEDDAAHQAIERFRRRVRDDVVYGTVASPSEFHQGIIQALTGWERRTLRGATTTAEAFYQPWLSGEQDFGHQAHLVGREGELAELERFVNSEQRVLVLRASWGQGKSRVLLELGRRIGRRARFVKEEVVLSREVLNISAVDPCVIVLEDAQRRAAPDRRLLLALVRRFGPEVKVVVSVRPSHADAVAEETRQLGFSASEVANLAIAPLGDRQHSALVTGILGREDEEAHIITERTKGNVLAGVVTARRFRRGAITLGQIESGDDFRHSVLQAFRAALEENTQGGVDRRFGELLRIVALAGPFRTDADDTIRAVAEFLDWKPHVVRSTLADLVEGHFLVLHGRLVRVPVDAIAEELRREACVDARGGSLGYAEEALRRLWPVLGGSLLRNVAALEWELRQEGKRADFLREFWPHFTAIYDAAFASQRVGLLAALEDAAPYAPAEILAFAHHALPSGLGRLVDHELVRARTYADMLHDGFSKSLQGVLYHAEHVAEACDLLWSMAEHDERDPKRHTDSAERVLRDAGKYRPRTDLAVYTAFLQWTKRRRHGNQVVPDRRLAEYLGPLLEREMEQNWSDGEAIHLSVRGLSAKALADLRKETLKVLESIALGEDLAAVAVALEQIGPALAPPRGGFGRVPTPAEIAQWYSEDLEAFETIQRIGRAHGSRAVDLCVLREIGWVAEHSEHAALKERAQAEVARIRNRLEGSLELALARAYHLHRGVRVDRHEEHHREITKIAAAHEGLDAQTLLSKVRGAFEPMRAAGLDPDPTIFFAAVARTALSVGEALVEEALVAPEDEVLVPSLGGVVDGIADADGARAAALAEKVLASGAVLCLRSIANTYRSPHFVQGIGADRALTHLERLLSMRDRWVREGALAAIGFRDELPRGERVRLLLGYDLAACPSSGEEWAQALHTLVADCSDQELEVVARKLGDAAELEYWACDVIETLARRVPAGLVDTLVARVPRAAEDEFEAVLDPAQKDPLASLPESARERGMTALGACLGSEDFKVAHAASSLFHKLSTGDRTVMRRVHLAWLRSGRRDLILQVAESLRYKESEFLIEEEEIVVALLRAAELQGMEFLRDIESELHAVASRGTRSGVPGQPFERDVLLRERAGGISSRHEPGGLVARFYAAVARHAQDTIDSFQRINEERFG